eukprot:scaffold933_cov27-Tisochrysis_lutea.AAC.1
MDNGEFDTSRASTCTTRPRSILMHSCVPSSTTRSRSTEASLSLAWLIHVKAIVAPSESENKRSGSSVAKCGRTAACNESDH